MKKYCLNIILSALRNRFIHMLLLLINISVIVMAGFLLENYNEARITDIYIKSYLDIKNLYSIANTWEIDDNEAVMKMEKKQDGGIISYTTNYEKRMQQYGTLRYGIENIANYIAYNMDIREVRDNLKFKDRLTFMQNINGDAQNVELFLGKPFGMQIKYPIITGRNLIQEDYDSTNQDYWNVLAGYDFMEDYKLGDVLTLELPRPYDQSRPSTTSDTIGQKLKIIGFIKKDTEILENLTDGRLFKADNKLIIPLKDHTGNQFMDIVKYGFLSVGSNFVITKDPKGVEKLFLEEARKDGYEGKKGFIRLMEPDFDYRNNREMTNDKSLTLYTKFLAVAVFTALIVTFISIWLLIRKNRRNYGIIMLSGGTRKDIAIGLTLELFIVILLSDFIGYLIYYRMFQSTLPVAVLICQIPIMILIILFSTLIILKRKSVEYFIRLDVTGN